MKVRLNRRYIEVCNEKGEVTGTIKVKGNAERKDVLQYFGKIVADVIAVRKEMGIA